MAISTSLDGPILPGEFSDDVSPESAEKLFKAIVLQTIKEACSEIPDAVPQEMPVDWEQSARSNKPREEAWEIYVKSHAGRRREAIRDREDARKWLLNGGRDYALICNLANWEPGYILRGSNKLMASGWPSRSAESLAARLE